jgi:tagatose 1,6-diphosphate aldolase GatY/KbaY
VGAFTAYDLEAALAACRAAADTGTGVIILLSARSYMDRDGEALLAALLAVAAHSPARACVQLDHCDRLEVLESALAAGVGAVMADGALLPYEENVALVARAVAVARKHGSAVEAELGSIQGDEDTAQAATVGALTDPEQAEDFVARTGTDCLAVSIGNVHGHYSRPPELDLGRLRAIRSRVSAPLSLHGASGLPDTLLQRAINAGIRKVNVNTELRIAYLDATRESLPDAVDGTRLTVLHAAQVAAVQSVVQAKLAVLGASSSE